MLQIKQTADENKAKEDDEWWYGYGLVHGDERRPLETQ
jgi:hypothetical protein